MIESTTSLNRPGTETASRRALWCVLVMMLLGSFVPALAKDMSLQQVKDKVKQIQSEEAIAKVKMRDGRRIQGRISSSDGEGFSITNKAGSQAIPYAEVADVKKKVVGSAAETARDATLTALSIISVVGQVWDAVGR